VNALVALPHGEGFGLPIFEAAYSGLPVVSTGWSGQLDFLVNEDGKDCFYNVAFDLQPVPKEVVWDGVLVQDSMWAYPRESSAKEKMRLCYQEDEEQRDISRATDILDRFSPEKQYSKFVSLLEEYCDAADGSDEWLNEIESIIQEYE
jgi:glycosyltransferase involved in cell wall biosynthesis